MERIFSDPNVKPSIRSNGHPHRRNHDDTAGSSSNKRSRGAQVLVRTGRKVVVSKYFYGEHTRRTGNLRPPAHSPGLPHHCDWGVRDGYFDPASGEVFYDELTWLCLNQYGASIRRLFNVGLFHQYGWANPPPRRLVLPQTDRVPNAPAPSTNTPGQRLLHPSVDDNMESIMRLAQARHALQSAPHRHRPHPHPFGKEKLSGGGRPSAPFFLKVMTRSPTSSNPAAKPAAPQDEHPARLARRHRGIH